MHVRYLAVLALVVGSAGRLAAQTPPAAPATPGVSTASLCGPGSVCAEYEASLAVFVGRVSLVSPHADDRTVGPMVAQAVTFEVIEDFKGSVGGGTSMTFDPAAPGARTFTLGENVLVYAKRSSDGTNWFAGCSRTRRVELTEPELITLRQLQRGTRGGSVEGWLQIPNNPRPPVLPQNTDLSRAQISLQPFDGAETIIVTTQPTGYFLFPWLRTGTYRLRLESPGLAPFIRDVIVGDTTRCQTVDIIPARPR
jgi:hypothetical protein